MIKKVIRFLKKIHRLTYTLENKIDVSSRANVLLNSALTSTDNIVNKKIKAENELIVSFTTYSKRIHDVHLVIESIAQQTIKPDRVILWLDETEFTINTIPLILHKQIKRGLEVRFCPNYKSYKKLIPTLPLFPEANIITIDDDILYPHDMIEGLVKEHQQYPNCIIGHRVHQITFENENQVKPYVKWDHEIDDEQVSVLNMAVGVGGVFYPKNSLNKECLNIKTFSVIAPNADDVWFKAMTTLNNYTTKKVNDDRDFWTRFLLLESSQDIALTISNVNDGGNDKQIENVFKKYDVYQLLAK